MNESILLIVIKALEPSSSQDDFIGVKFILKSDYVVVVNWMNKSFNRTWRFLKLFIHASRLSSHLDCIKMPKKRWKKSEHTKSKSQQIIWAKKKIVLLGKSKSSHKVTTLSHILVCKYLNFVIASQRTHLVFLCA